MKTTTIRQGAMIPGTPAAVYALLMDERQHAAFTGGEAKISKKIGGSFTTFDGWATGQNIELIPNKKIVQTWRGSDWPADHYSTITITLVRTSGGTKLMFQQTNVPTKLATDVARGWREYYWGPMKATLRQ